MKLKFYFLPILLLFLTNSFSQNENNFWCLGNYGGLDFSSGSPVDFTSAQSAGEGCATISNASGQLLLYSNGIKVWDRNHAVMPNGFGLNGNISTSQSCLFIPKPGVNNLYYLFTVDQIGMPGGLQYSEIDLLRNGGLGDVTANKNIPLHTPTCEKICAIKNNLDNSYWVITHGFTNNNFLAYKVDSNGLNPTPVISSVGAVTGVLSNILQTVGYLVISPDGSKLVCVNSSINTELFDFDMATGIVSNPRTITTSTPNRYDYGAAFSPSSNVLYLSAGSSTGRRWKIYQYDLLAADIPASETFINSNLPRLGEGSLQLAKDCKIYFTNVRNYDGNRALSVIHNPDQVGLGCNFQQGTVQLSGLCGLGLPQTYQTSSCQSRTILNNEICAGSDSNFSLAGGMADVISAVWNFGDGHTSTAISPNNNYSSPGNYTISGQFTTATGQFTVTKNILVMPNPVAHTPQNVLICDPLQNSYDLNQLRNVIMGNQSNSFYSLSFFASEQEAIDDENLLPSVITTPPGVTTVFAKVYRLSNFDCFDIISFTITVSDAPVLNTATDCILCDESNSNAGTANFDLDTKIPELLNGQSPNDFAVTYFLNATDAVNHSNPITTTYTNTSNPQVIFAKVTRLDTGCFAITSFNIVVQSVPDFDINPTYVLCANATTPVVISLPNTFDNYLWSTGETASSISITEVGNYEVTVTENHGGMSCSVTKNFEVLLSDTALIKKIQTSDWTDNENSIIIDATGPGDYEFSLNGIDYQEEAFFNNLRAGEYIVFVRDKNGCGVASVSVWLLVYPKFFTPNEDGYNDCWRIKFSETEPEMTVEIFDRYGKLLKKLSKTDACWDGSFNGNPLVSEDYWFVVTRENGRKYKGHFSLKR